MGDEIPDSGHRRARAHVIPFFAFPPEIRRVMHTTNALESVHAPTRDGRICVPLAHGEEGEFNDPSVTSPTDDFIRAGDPGNPPADVLAKNRIIYWLEDAATKGYELYPDTELMAEAARLLRVELGRDRALAHPATLRAATGTGAPVSDRDGVSPRRRPSRSWVPTRPSQETGPAFTMGVRS